MLKEPHQRSKLQGVSLIEVVVVLAIIGLSLKLVLPSIGDWMSTLALRSAAEAVKGGVEKARQDALRRNATMSFWLVKDEAKSLSNACTLSSTGPSWVVSKLDPDKACGAAPSDAVAPRIREKWSAAESGMGFELIGRAANGQPADSVEFDSLGRPRAADLASIELKHPQGKARRMMLLISAAGSVRLCEPDVGATDTRKC